MHILICHERFLFRYGADRVLMLLAQGLGSRGCQVTVMANRFDTGVLAQFASRIVPAPFDHVAYEDLNEFTATWLRENWNSLFTGSFPDIVVVGGWPFIAAIPFFREVCANIVFFDQGVVPEEGYPEGTRKNLQKLQDLRRKFLRDCSHILANSEFTIRTQSAADVAGSVPTTAVLLGADHFENSLWAAEHLQLNQARGTAIELVRSLKLQGRRPILNLGRWEPGSYKNSQTAFPIMRRIEALDPAVTLLVLEESGQLLIPPDLTSKVIGIGFPDDTELVEVMGECELGISVSLWEGFNLPLAEMQWLGRPALAFDLGAHPEVIAHPWYLCRDERDMAAKAAAVLRGNGPPGAERNAALNRFRSYFRWSRFNDECWSILRQMVVSRMPSSTLIIDVTNSTRDPANSGVIRVTRRLCRSLQAYQDPIFVVWDERKTEYVLPTRQAHDQLSQFNGPGISSHRHLSGSAEDPLSLSEYVGFHNASGGWLVIPELKLERAFHSIREYARRHGYRLAAIFYDSIALLRPELCNDEVRANHRDYMAGLADCDLVMPISAFSFTCLQDFWSEAGISPRASMKTNLLPGEFGGATRAESISEPNVEGLVRILCVSTLEPRKNHRKLLEACLLMETRHPDLDWRLTLVGNRYAGAFDIAEYVERVARSNARIEWLGIVDDSTLQRLYKQATFTVYASEIEGFGLPIVESIWHGKPCICSREGVMAELAAEGGCFTTDVRDSEALSEAIYTLAINLELRSRLATEARSRRIKSWNDYAEDFLLALRSRGFIATPTAPFDLSPTYHPISWEDVLYKGCLTENWQMQDSERLGLTALLARLNPQCSIEVGTYCGGSLSLISRFSRMVFSIDIDPTVSERFRHFENVTFLTGDSGLILPILLKELETTGMNVDFLLIDGDHSPEGVRRDVNAVLSYAPKKAMFLMVHDSFNPGCRWGLENAGWASSPHCHFVDLDFIPGRVVEHGGPTNGQMWGGLALAYFAPARRSGTLRIGQSARTLFELAAANAAQTNPAMK